MITAAANTADNASVLLSLVCARLKQVSRKTLSLIKFLRILQDTIFLISPFKVLDIRKVPPVPAHDTELSIHSH